MKEMKMNKIIFSLFAFFLLLAPLSVLAANEDTLSVTAVSGSRLGYSLYWGPNQGNVKIERSIDATSFSQVGETSLNYFVDYNVEKGVSYTYRVNVGGKIITSNASDLSAGVSVVSDIRVESGVANMSEASVVIYFKTDKLAKSQIFYGESAAYSSETEVDNSLNQSHTILLDKLKPNSTYHFKIKIIDKNDQNPTESPDQLFTTPAPVNETSIIQIIIKALTDAFAGFTSWFTS